MEEVDLSTTKLSASMTDGYRGPPFYALLASVFSCTEFVFHHFPVMSYASAVTSGVTLFRISDVASWSAPLHQPVSDWGHRLLKLLA